MIKIELESNTVAEMTETLQSLLSALTGGTVPQTKHAVDDSAGGKAKENIIKPAPAKAVPAKAAPKPEPEPEPEPEPTTEPEDDDLGLPEPTKEYKLEDAVAVAQDRVAKGKSAEVRKALNAVAGEGARIGGLSGDQIGQFIAALKG